MNGIGLLQAALITLVKAAQTAGTSEVNSDVVDCSGFEGVVFSATFGTAAANNGIKIQQGNESDGSDMSDLAGSSNLGNTAQVVSQIHKPTKRYVRAVAIRGTSSTLDSLTAISYGAATCPVTQTATAENNVSPAEGTA